MIAAVGGSGRRQAALGRNRVGSARRGGKPPLHELFAAPQGNRDVVAFHNTPARSTMMVNDLIATVGSTRNEM